MFLSKIFLGLALLFFIPGQGSAADSALKPGDVIGPHNWQRVQGMVGENLLNRIKGGYTFKIKESRLRRHPKEYIEATEKYAGKVTLGNRGELLNYVAGQPFPNLSASDPQAGLKLAWNVINNWQGDDFKDGGGTATGKISTSIIEKTGSERRVESIRHEIRTRGRVTLDPKPSFERYDHIDWMAIRATDYPRDTSGTTTLEIRYVDPDREDDFYTYVPSIRRVRRSPPTQRCATMAPLELIFDDINFFSGKVTNFNYKFLGEKQMLGNFSPRHLVVTRKTGDYLPLDEDWELVNTYVLEITPKDPSYCYPKKILYLDHHTLYRPWMTVWDAKGNLWKEALAFWAPIKLSDGQEAISPTTITIVNVENGRANVITQRRSFNNGYQPSLFTLQTLQTVMRGGSVR